MGILPHRAAECKARDILSDSEDGYETDDGSTDYEDMVAYRTKPHNS